MTLRECYEELGADYEDVMRRFMNEERVDRFLTMLLKDDSFAQLRDAMEREDAELAFRGAHSLKGIGMNLGLTGLAEAAEALTEELRQGKMSTEAETLFQDLEKCYKNTVNLIDKLLKPEGNTGES